MNRTARALLLGMALLLALAAPAAAANLDVRGEWDFECGGPCPAQFHVFQTQDAAGNVTGVGRTADNSNTWSIVGKVTENDIQFAVSYNEVAYSATMTGTASPNGLTIAGTFSDNSFSNQPFTMNRLLPPPGGGGGEGGGGGGSGPPPPEPGKTVNVRPVTGKVSVKCKGDDDYEELDSSDQIPVGCLLDTRKGTVNVTASVGGNETNSSWFWQGIFKVSQKKGTNQETVVSLAGPLANCPSTKVSSAAKKRGRRLWGKGKGRFRTRGRRGSAAVRGTEWLVEDNCDSSTTVRVKDGSVNFRDFVKDRTVVVKKGGSYTARPK